MRKVGEHDDALSLCRSGLIIQYIAWNPVQDTTRAVHGCITRSQTRSSPSHNYLSYM